MAELYYYAGVLAVWGFLAVAGLYLANAVIYPLFQSLAFHAVAIYAICRAGRASRVKWHKLPISIKDEWLGFMGGGTVTISSDLYVWRGPFDWNLRGAAIARTQEKP